MLSSAWTIVSSCCLRRECTPHSRLGGRAGLGAEFDAADDRCPTSPVEQLVHLLPPLAPSVLPEPSIPLPVAVALPRKHLPFSSSEPSPLSGADAVVQLLCDPSAPPLLTALRFILVAAAAGGRVRPAYYDASGAVHPYLLPFFEGEGDEPLFLCVCRQPEAAERSGDPAARSYELSVHAPSSDAPALLSAAGRGLLQHLSSCRRAFPGPTNSSGAFSEGELVNGASKTDLETAFKAIHSISGREDTVEKFPEPLRRSGESPFASGSGDFDAPFRSRVGGRQDEFRSAPRRSHSGDLSRSRLSRAPTSGYCDWPSFRPAAPPFFGRPCPACGGLSLSPEAWRQFLAAAAHEQGLPPRSADVLFARVVRDLQKQFARQGTASSASSVSTLHRWTRREQRNLSLLLLAALASAAEAAGAEVELAAARAAALSPSTFCVMGAFSDKWLPKSFQVKEVLVLPPASSLTMVQTRRGAGLLGVTGDAFGLRNEAAATVRAAAETLAAELADGDLGSRSGLPASPQTESRSLQRRLATMYRALDELHALLPCQFVNQEQAFVCQTRGVSLGGLVVGVGPDAQKASDVVALHILRDLLTRVYAGMPPARSAKARSSALSQPAPDRLERLLLDCMQGVAASLDRPPAVAASAPVSSSSSGLLPLVTFPFSKAAAWTGEWPTSPSARGRRKAGGGEPTAADSSSPFNATTSGCAACVCLVHDLAKRLLVCHVGDVTAILARPLPAGPTRGPAGKRDKTRKAEGREATERGAAFGEASRWNTNDGGGGAAPAGPEASGVRPAGAEGPGDRMTRGEEDGRRHDAGRDGRACQAEGGGGTDRLSARSAAKAGRETETPSIKMPHADTEPHFFGLVAHNCEPDRGAVLAGFAFEAIVLTREHTLRAGKERKRVINAGAVALGHVSGTESSSSRSATSKHVTPPRSPPQLPLPESESPVGGEADAAGGSCFASRLADGGEGPGSSRDLASGNPLAQGSARRPRLHQQQLPHQRFLSEGPPSLFLCPDTSCPPLRCTRLLGMTAAQQYGVCSTPDVASVDISKISSFGFVLVASSVIWDLLDPQDAVDRVARELRRQHVEELRLARERHLRVVRQQHRFLRLARRSLQHHQTSATHSLHEMREAEDDARWTASEAAAKPGSASFLRRDSETEGRSRRREAFEWARLKGDAEEGETEESGSEEEGDRDEVTSLPDASDEDASSSAISSAGKPHPDSTTQRGRSLRAGGRDHEGEKASPELHAPSLSRSSFSASSRFPTLSSTRAATIRHGFTREDSVLCEVRGRVDAAAEASLMGVDAARATAGLFSEKRAGRERCEATGFPVGLDFQAAATLVVQQFMEEWQLQREGLSMPDATVVIIPFRAPSPAAKDSPRRRGTSYPNREEASEAKKSKRRSHHRRGNERETGKRA
ncbi:protein phosphatase 2C domain-containing protein [Besnoitia besnoiti]|uniref:Protein phosphatase 2C domain-containing protein n=1 Tax=Besnoitia besnoiti TaxID=94643 RepID=A0A2A9MJV0_BESBE|nr:protein phosphatase 2C domain-containing protein [Besnoitia besnoiti]PFH35680.1 protein phosphatase 2C domain-containing protein [Besnoitia besnoiti]